MSISELEALDLQDNEDEVKENEEEFPRELGNNDNDENAAAALGHSRRISLVDEPHNIRPNRDGSISYALKFGRNGTGGGARGSLSQWKKPTHNRSRSRSRSAERPNRTSSKASEMAFRQSITPLDETAAHVETGATEPTSKDARNVPGPQDSNRDVPQKTFRLQPLKGSSDTDDVSSSGRSLADVDNETETISGVGRGREYDLRVSNANRMRSVAPSSNLPTPLQRAASVKGGFGQNTEGTGESSKPFGDTILSDCQKFWRKGGDGEGDLARHKIPAVLVDSLSSVLASSQHLIVEFPPDSRDSIYKAEEAALFITQTCRLLYGIRCSMIVFDESTPPEALISAGESRFRISRSPSRGLDQFDSTLSQPKHRGRTRSMEANSASIQVPDEGVIFSDIMVCHNLHLAPAETQAVVLEAMRMRLIGIGGHKRDLSSNFCVVATYESPSSGKSASVMPSLSRHFVRFDPCPKMWMDTDLICFLSLLFLAAATLLAFHPS